jgi:hypothetical protein
LKISISRSSLLTAIVIAVLLAAAPLAIFEIVRTGELYVFSRRFVPDMLARLHGPGRLRFIFQPTFAIILGARDGVKDARLRLPPFLSALIFHGQRRSELLRGALASVRDLVAVAILLDVISQLLILRIRASRRGGSFGSAVDFDALCVRARNRESDRSMANRSDPHHRSRLTTWSCEG